MIHDPKEITNHIRGWWEEHSTERQNWTMRKILRNPNCFKNELKHWAMSAKLQSLLLIRALYLKSLFKVELVSCCCLPLLLTDPAEPSYAPGYINPICPTVSVTWAALFVSFQLVPPEHVKEQSWHLGLVFFSALPCMYLITWKYAER